MTHDSPIRTRGTAVHATATTHLPSDRSAPALARGFVTTEIADAQVPLDDIVLVVSELVTNSVKAGSSSIALTLRGTETGLELVVEDDAAGFPELRDVTPDSLGGRGLAIVAELADSWSAVPTSETRGKRVSAWWLAR